jgi:hypothetical protein
MSKGDNVRPHDKKSFDRNFEAVFGKKELKTWNPERETKEELNALESPDGPYWQLSGYRGEWSCPHGVGHGNHIHGCDGCCQRADFPGRRQDEVSQRT